MRNHALLILNGPLEPTDIAIFENLWSNARLRVCADAGYLRLRSWADAHCHADWEPHLVVGDLDSIDNSVLSKLDAKGIQVMHLPDQDRTDFDKALEVIYHTVEHLEMVIATGGLWGRMDHTLASLNLLYSQKDKQIALIGDSSLVTLLRIGENQVFFDKEDFSPTCGIVTLADPAHVYCNSLAWPLHGIELRVGGLQSTSNRITEDAMEAGHLLIKGDVPVLWLMTLNN